MKVDQNKSLGTGRLGKYGIYTNGKIRDICLKNCKENVACLTTITIELSKGQSGGVDLSKKPFLTEAIQKKQLQWYIQTTPEYDCCKLKSKFGRHIRPTTPRRVVPSKFACGEAQTLGWCFSLVYDLSQRHGAPIHTYTWEGS
ncbi:hypothetical protein Trydic_g6319 [Trypoxylus dichotomus]